MGAVQIGAVQTGSAKQVKQWIADGVLLAPDAPSLLKIPAGSGGTGQPYAHYFVARHDLVEAVFAAPDHFHAGHYDRLMQQLGSDLLMMPGPGHEQNGDRRAVLEDALNQFTPKRAGAACAPDQWLRETVAQRSREVLQNLAASRAPQTPFNLVWDYGQIVPYLVFTQFMGVTLPVRGSLAARGWNFARNMIQPGPPVRMQGISGEAWTLVLWSQLFFAQLFGNFDNRAVIRTLAKYGLGRMKAYVDFANTHPGAVDPDGFYAAILAANAAAPADHKLSDADLCAILLEFLGTAFLLPAGAFCTIAGALFDEDFAAVSGIDFDRFTAQIKPRNGAHDWHSCFDEMLRLRPLTPQIDRVAARHGADDPVIAGHALAHGDRVTMLVEQAARDPRVFGAHTSAHYAPDPARPYLEFRPSSAPRRCFGRSWALTMLREMCLALDDRHVVRALGGEDGKLTSLLPRMPDRLMVQFV